MNIFETIGLQKDLKDIQLEKLDENLFKVISSSGDKIIEVLDIDLSSKKMRIRHDHHTYLISFQDELDRVLEKLGINSSDQSGETTLKAPMPGRILEVSVEVGQSVSEGDGLLVLEAMKMENVLRAEMAGTIKKINVSAEESVDKNQVLVEITAD